MSNSGLSYRRGSVLLWCLVSVAGWTSSTQATEAKVQQALSSPAAKEGWLTDAEGRQYREERLPLTQARRLGPDLVRTLWGVSLDIVREDDQFYYYKLYRDTSDQIPTRLRAANREIPGTKTAPVPQSRGWKLRAFDSGLPTSGMWRDGFDVADMNGDGQLDIVAPPPRKTLQSPAIFLGSGNGRWRLWREAAFPRIGFDYGTVAIGDFNSDGHRDLALGIHLKGIVTLLGNGQGVFSEPGGGTDTATSGTSDPKAFLSRSVVIIDWNRDGRPDIAALGEGGMRGAAHDSVRPQGSGIAIFLNAGGSRWRRQAGEAGSVFGTNLAAGDFNADGHHDLVMASSVMGRRDLVAMGREDGSWTVSELSGLPEQSFVRAVAAADFNRDGLDDIAAAWLSFAGGSWRHGLDIFFAAPTGMWGQHVPLLSERGRDALNGVASGDLDGDGLADLTGVSEDGRVMVWRNRSDANFVREKAADARSVGNCRGSAIRIVDLDQDGKGELVGMFGQEPTMGPNGCPRGGAMRVWKVLGAGSSVSIETKQVPRRRKTLQAK